MQPTKEQVAAWAREAGFARTFSDIWACDLEELQRFAALAFAAGRSQQNALYTELRAALGFDAMDSHASCVERARELATMKDRA